MTQIDISPISGFPEWLPDKRIVEQEMLDVIRRSYELFGFTPIETPSVERWPVLTAKGGIQRQVFSVGRPSSDNDERDIGLHFDLTVPLARYVASRSNELTFPFRRYQIQKVWRGERAQRGRFREFYQCDIDIIGSETLDLLYDAEVARVIGAVFDALGVSDIKVHISNRKILTSLAEAFRLGASDIETVLRLIDKASRDGAAAVAALLSKEGFETDVADAFGSLLDVSDLTAARTTMTGAGADVSGVDDLEQVHDAALALGMRADQIMVDLGIARGLDYYTGTVYETFVVGHESWGSVCSGGRYEDLAGYFTDRRLPGVGVSIGATRLLDLLTQSEIVLVGAKTPTKVLVATQDRASYLSRYLEFAASLRGAGIASEVYLQARKLGDQLKYAGDLGIPIVLIAGANELDRDALQLRTMNDGQQTEVPISGLVSEVERLLQTLDPR